MYKKLVIYFFMTALIMVTNLAGAEQPVKPQLSGTIPTENAIRIGIGKNTVIEFEDPDCPFSRRVTDYMNKRQDVTRYIFFLPATQIHPDAMDKIRFVLCSKNSPQAFLDIMSGKYDKVKPPVCKDDKVEQTIKDHTALGGKLGASATPYLIINGTYVLGADFGKIESIIGPPR
ncbi:thioredoxin fold domain-containing protein [Candidatus Magnetominusculus xianensis]|uniref:Protein-disulfide isomerase n=1 Tax=Candidatus Magnetominusculus xianensis TaxID=1748249 RepID=A0ABR5SGB6_9BACT|nr:thioredoxin fold domain-containing protein [Candidatus Magnetominusculus xianensis]KWT88142.1 protein-disulfide isomerase [Candidatus Magnetominusculus xianensis]MBF0404448.1 thioredoxin fold domain-containing protein [Nitrospirota bacterium]